MFRRMTYINAYVQTHCTSRMRRRGIFYENGCQVLYAFIQRIGIHEIHTYMLIDIALQWRWRRKKHVPFRRRRRRRLLTAFPRTADMTVGGGERGGGGV